MKKVTLFYNPHCSTCRNAYDILNGQGCEIEIVEYLKDTPSEKELKEVLKKLGLKPQDLLRKKEPLFAEKYKSKKLTDDQWIKVMTENPILIERPVAIYGNKAVIGRPAERVVEILK
jgi:arsenate reductase (glutaredoxin)